MGYHEDIQSYIITIFGVHVGSVIKVPGMVKFEDVLWIGNHLKSQNGLQKVFTIHGFKPGSVRTTRLHRGQIGYLVSSQVPGLILDSCGVRIDLA